MKSRCWRYGDGWPALLVSALVGVATNVLAACPPLPADGKALQQDGLQLAWRPVANGSPIQPAAIPQGRHFSVEVQLCQGAAPAGATLERLDASMPEHRHGMNYRPRITTLGDGRYRAEGMMFHMSGRWQLEFEVRSATGTTRLVDDVRIR
jgi:hypothetical protein